MFIDNFQQNANRKKNCLIGKHDRLQMCAIFGRFGRSKDNCVIISYNSRSLKLYKKFDHVLKLCNWYIGIMWRLIFFTFFQTVEINIYLGSLLFYQQNYWKRVNKFWNQFFQFSTRSVKFYMKIAHMLKLCTCYQSIIWDCCHFSDFKN